ncbi:zinc metalloproteinase nas-14-like [Neocloeon triangulifer]|uniref:zinc metalloproteinase nas-14-like n=1 Tax=Neocloeon triangulifer TaxID=2078957 RepID=UPI00286F30C5|nr:zinc metalloproteinase nas-14-like [Neocloeon triangulifer]
MKQILLFVVGISSLVNCLDLMDSSMFSDLPNLIPVSFGPNYNREAVSRRIASWRPKSGRNIWELSGLREGDIMDQPGDKGRNVIIDPKYNWPNNTMVYRLMHGMTSKEKMVVKEAMEMIMQGSCMHFRPYRNGDKDYVYIQYNDTGCWSLVGRRGGAQPVNLQRDACFIPGPVAHELLHAAGFEHQHSAPDRNDYVFINYTNIEEADWDQFELLSASEYSELGVGYDYNSLMHYTRTAFSKNGEDTIIPYEDGVEIGQQDYVSDKDYRKLNVKYNCHYEDDQMENKVDWSQNGESNSMHGHANSNPSVESNGNHGGGFMSLLG